MLEKSCYYCGGCAATKTRRDAGIDRLVCDRCLADCFFQANPEGLQDGYYIPLRCTHCGMTMGAYIDPLICDVPEIYCWDCLNFNFEGSDGM